MKPPKCPICDTEHYPHQAHRFEPQKPEPPDRLAAAEQMGEENGLEEDEAISQETLRKREWRERNREQYNEYQRDYMRKYRRQDDGNG